MRFWKIPSQFPIKYKIHLPVLFNGVAKAINYHGRNGLSLVYHLALEFLFQSLLMLASVSPNDVSGAFKFSRIHFKFPETQLGVSQNWLRWTEVPSLTEYIERKKRLYCIGFCLVLSIKILLKSLCILITLFFIGSKFISAFLFEINSSMAKLF